MFWSFCSPKGGVGVSVTAAAVAARLARTTPALLVDFCGDVPELLGLDVADAPGVADWLHADAQVGLDALDRLVLEGPGGLHVLPRGVVNPTGCPTERLVQLVEHLGATFTVIADVGVLASDAPLAWHSVVCAAGDRTTLVVRACYLTLRRGRRVGVAVDDLFELAESGRALGTLDIEAVFQQPVTARCPVEPTIARSADAGLLARRPPRQLRRAVDQLLRAGNVLEVVS